jgi:hypothetical protein
MILKYLDLLRWLKEASELDKDQAWEGFTLLKLAGVLDAKASELVDMAFEVANEEPPVMGEDKKDGE